MPGQRSLLFLWGLLFSDFPWDIPIQQMRKRPCGDRKPALQQPPKNGLLKIRLIWRIYLSDLTPKPFSLQSRNRQRRQIQHTLTHWPAAHQVLRGRQIKGWEELSENLKQSPLSSFQVPQSHIPQSNPAIWQCFIPVRLVAIFFMECSERTYASRFTEDLDKNLEKWYDSQPALAVSCMSQCSALHCLFCCCCCCLINIF